MFMYRFNRGAYARRGAALGDIFYFRVGRYGYSAPTPKFALLPDFARASLSLMRATPRNAGASPAAVTPSRGRSTTPSSGWASLVIQPAAR